MRAACFGVAAALLAGCTSVRATNMTFWGTQWRLAQVNGHAPHQPLTIAFGKDDFRAYLGCNWARGGYTVADYRIVPVQPIGITERGCGSARPLQIPMMTMETWAFDILKNPMAMEWHSGRRLTLKNSAGTILLERAP